MCDTTLAQVLVHASSHPHSHPCVRLDRLFSPLFLTLFPSVCFSNLFFCFCLNLDFYTPPLPCGLHRGKILLALRQMRSLALWSITRLSEVMSPTSSTISTQTLLTSSSRSNPATRRPRICMTRSSVTRPLAERSLHHCLFRIFTIHRCSLS